MTKYAMLGVNDQNRCCILNCLVPFEQLKPDQIEKEDFEYSATNWGGNDDIDRTLSISNLSVTGNSIELKEPICVEGIDYDCGHQYPWEFEFSKIYETKNVEVFDSNLLETSAKSPPDDLTGLKLTPVCEKCGYVVKSSDILVTTCPHCKRRVARVNIDFSVNTLRKFD